MTADDDAPAPDDDVVLRALDEAFLDAAGEPSPDLLDRAISAFRTRPSHRLAVVTSDTSTAEAGVAGDRVIRFAWDASTLEVTLDGAVRIRVDPPATLTMFVETPITRQTVLMPATGLATAAFDGFPMRITMMVAPPITTPWITG